MIGKAALILLALAFASRAWAQEDADLARLPADVPVAQAKAPSDRRIFLEDAYSAASRDAPWPFDTGVRTNRVSLDARVSAAPTGQIKFVLSDRMSAINASGAAEDGWRNDLREAYLNISVGPNGYLDVGRVNLRTGLALGFQPLDFLRAGSSVPEASADPTTARENRLGVVMARYQHFWTWGSASLVLAPRLENPRLEPDRDAFDLRLDQTNGWDRALAAFTLNKVPLAPQFVVASDDGRVRLGVSGSALVGKSIVAYVEWAAQRQLAYGEDLERSVGSTTLAEREWRGQLVLGASWANALAKTTVNIEYHYNGAGVDGGQWRSWRDAAYDPSLAAAAFKVRASAQLQQEPFSREEVFVRAQVEDFGLQRLTLSGFSFINLADGSSRGEVSVAYDVDRKWSLAGYLDANIGPRGSEWGSVEPRWSLTLQIKRYL